MVLTDDGCQHPTWRVDFAANGKLHEFCVACRAERRISDSAEGGEVARLRNGLRWIRHVAAMNSVGIATGPEQMRALTVLAEKVLDGAELVDYESGIGLARGKVQGSAMPDNMDLVVAAEPQHGAGEGASAEPIPEQWSGMDESQLVSLSDRDEVVTSNGKPS